MGPVTRLTEVVVDLAIRVLLAVIVLAFVVAGIRACTGCKIGPPNVPVPVSEGGTACSRACSRLAALGCPEAQPTPGGTTCEQVCSNAEESGVVSLAPDCVESSRSCDEAAACGR